MTDAELVECINNRRVSRIHEKLDIRYELAKDAVECWHELEAYFNHFCSRDLNLSDKYRLEWIKAKDKIIKALRHHEISHD